MPETSRPFPSAQRVANRLKRELLRLPAVRDLAAASRNRLLARHAGSLPPLSAEQRELVAEMEETGVCITTLDAIAGDAAPGVKASLTELAAELAATPAAGNSTVRLAPDRMYAKSDVFELGLRDSLLDVVENHLHLPPHYFGADVRRELPDGAVFDVRQWHLDVEDHRMLKVIVYLNDVDADGGPFEYIPHQTSRKACAALGYHTGFLSDEVLSRVVPRGAWRACTGPKWTAIVTDTCRVLHRARPPTRNERFSLTLSYTSRWPLKTYEVPVPLGLEALVRKMPPRQIDCLPRAWVSDLPAGAITGLSR